MVVVVRITDDDGSGLRPSHRSSVAVDDYQDPSEKAVIARRLAREAFTEAYDALTEEEESQVVSS